MSQKSRHLWPAAAMAALMSLAGCSGAPADPIVSEPAPTPSPRPSATAMPSASVSPAVTPSPKPTAQPSAAPAEPGVLDAWPLISLSGIDPASGNALLGGFVVGIVESGGTCTYVITRDGSEVLRRSTNGESNKDDTTCGAVELSRAELGAGSYRVTLIYDNAIGRATSDPVSLEVPS